MENSANDHQPGETQPSETKPERREKKRRKKRAKMLQHGKALAKVYRDAVQKRTGQR